MAFKRILLTIPEPIFKKLKNEMELYSYMSIQEVLLQTLRDKYFLKKTKKETRGRPRKLDELAVLSRKNIFSKNGARLSV